MKVNSLLITGAFGFIGSVLSLFFRYKFPETKLFLCDYFGEEEKWKNLQNTTNYELIPPDEVIAFLKHQAVDAIIHMGAISDTLEEDMDLLYENNVRFSQQLYKRAAEQGSFFIYASSAATFGAGEHGYFSGFGIEKLRPLNKYGYSKQLFDLWVKQESLTMKAIQPSVVLGLKFFNVFGPNEYHKGPMKSVANVFFEQFRSSGKIRLFKSQRSDIPHGQQKRDFIYVKEAAYFITEMLFSLFKKREEKQAATASHSSSSSSTYVTPANLLNLGSFQARSFLDIAKAIEKAQMKQKNHLKSASTAKLIEFIDMNPKLARRYQYYTKAEKGIIPFSIFWKRLNIKRETYLEESVDDYVRNHLACESPYLQLQQVAHYYNQIGANHL